MAFGQGVAAGNHCGRECTRLARSEHDPNALVTDHHVPPSCYHRSTHEEQAAIAMKRMVVEIGMGTDIRGTDYTKAAVRALRDALWHNSLGVAKALGMPTDSMVVEILIGVPRPARVDKAAVLAVLPHGTGTVKVVEGGLEIANDEGTDHTVIANAAAVVHLDI